MRPSDRSYLESHEWAKLDGDIVTVGISDFAVEQLGELVYLDLPENGDDATCCEGFGEVESVKAVSDVNAPVTGEIVEVNSDLADNLETLQNDPFEGGWLVKIKVEGADALNGLLDAAAYEEVVASQS
ncbi:MAG: glycine cleavage system protein GcvH [Planctomycetes bacterium]|nr:glycine cleavage system protein GcvH [Planctomycetota bacterium]MCP4771975.1 glycine cleavage system protein GcvH [Planctomycetota bacterium]MCP4860374.1 glycine cleavage system protein GcvH [Planctomycetota bacterium]